MIALLTSILRILRNDVIGRLSTTTTLSSAFGPGSHAANTVRGARWIILALLRVTGLVAVRARFTTVSFVVGHMIGALHHTTPT